MQGRILNLLLVEDHHDSAVALAALLRAFGHHVGIAETCCDARRLFDAEHFDLILCDLGLPDGDGCALVAELCQRRPVPSVAVTGYGMAEDVDRCRAAGFFDHVTKPIVADRLHAILDQISHQSGPAIGPRPHSSALAHP